MVIYWCPVGCRLSVWPPESALYHNQAATWLFGRGTSSTGTMLAPGADKLTSLEAGVLGWVGDDCSVSVTSNVHGACLRVVITASDSDPLLVWQLPAAESA